MVRGIQHRLSRCGTLGVCHQIGDKKGKQMTKTAEWVAPSSNAIEEANKIVADTQTITRIYVHIERVVDCTTGWSYIDRVYASFWGNHHKCLRDTTYGLALRTDAEIFEAVQGSLETMTEEGFDYDDPEVRVSQNLKTDVEGTYWEIIGRRV